MAVAEGISSWSPPVVPFENELVTIVVGSDQKKFAVHKSLICASSKFFSSAFNGGYIETHSSVMKLPDVAPKFFEFFYRWLYSSPCRSGDPLYWPVSDAETQPDMLVLEIYLLADRLLIPGLKILALEQIRDTFSAHDPTLPSHDFISFLFKNEHLKFMQLYLVKHITYWISKSKDRDEWVELIKVHDKLTLEMVIDFANLDTNHVAALKVVHPSQVLSPEVELGMNLAVLAVEARENDVEPVGDSGAKVLARAQIRDCFQHLITKSASQGGDSDFSDEEKATTVAKRVSLRNHLNRQRNRRRG